MRALICLSQGVGNVVMATPMIGAVRSLGWEVDVFCNARCDAADLLRGWDAVADVFDGWRVYRKYDAVVRGVWCDLAWPPSMIPARDYISPAILDMRRHHEAQVNMTAAHKLGYRGEMPPPHCEAGRPGVDLPEKFTAICPGYGSNRSPEWDRKLWPHWAELCEDLRARERLTVCVGSEDDRALGWLPADIDLRGVLRLKQSAGVLGLAEHVVAIDNGLAHVAAALGRPTTVLLGFTSPVKNRPLGPRVTVLTAGLECQPCQMTAGEPGCGDARCMAGISVARVLAAIEAVG